MLTLGQKIKAIRKEQGLTQAELVGDRITRNQLSLIENGINNPSLATLEFIASRLNVPMSYFLSNEDFSLHKCQKLITRCETLLEAEEYETAVTEIEEFLNNINSQDDNTMGDLLGRINSLLGMAYYKINKPKAKACLLEAVKYLEASDQPTYLSKVYYHLGILADEESNLVQAEHYLTKANKQIANISLENIILKLNIAYHMSYIYLKQERYSELITFINDNLKYSRKYEIFHNFGIFNMLISIAYRYTHNYKQAIQCTQKAIEYFQFSDDEVNKYTCFTNLGIWHRLSGDYENSLKHLDMAKKYFEYTDKIAKALNAKSEIAKTLFLIEKDCNESYKKLLNDVLNDIIDSNENKPDLLAIKGVCLLEEGDIDAAFEIFTEAEALTKNAELSEFIGYAFMGLSKIYKHQQQWEKAYTYLDKANALSLKATRNINFE